VGSIGSVLKEAREKKAVSLDEVHAKIKIHPRVLQLLEEDKFDKLPSPLFVKSFLKTYADFLQINSEELLDAYQKLGEKTPEQVLFIKTADERSEESKPIHRGLLVSGILFFAVGVGVAGIVYYLKQNPEKIPAFRLPHFKVISRTAPTAALPEKEKPVQKKSSPAKKTESAKKASEWLRSVDLGNFPVIDKKIPLELKVKAVDTVWLHITADGKIAYQGILRRGTSSQWTASDQIEIWTGNASNIFLTLNHCSLGSPGKGVVKRMVISRQGVKIPAQPAV
jgi:cytoskeleton protein RodZ